MNVFEDLEDSPEFKRIQNLKQIEFCLNIFYNNEHDLLNTIRYGTDSKNLTELHVYEKKI